MLPKQIYIKDEWFHLLVVFMVIFVVYFWSAPRTVVLEDDGIFILAAYFNGIAHPPGYPLYTLLGHLATYLPFGSVAFRVHLLSAFLGALACGCLWWFSRLIMPGKLFAYTASFAYGLSNIFWSQAIIAEVYVLNVLLFLLLLILVINYNVKQSRSLLLITAFVYGLALSNHWPLIILSTPMLICILWPARRQLIRHFPVAIPFILLGLSPYLWMVIRSQMDPVISFSGPINSFHDFLFTVSRENYSSVVTSPSAGWYDKLLFASFVLKETARQFGFIGIAFAILGFLFQWRYWSRLLCSALILGYLGNTFFLIGLLNFDYDLLHRVIFRVYPLIAYLVIVLWVALGVYITSEALVKHNIITAHRWYLHVGLFILVVGVAFAENLPDNFRAKDFWAQDYARVILGSLEENAILFSSGSFMTGQVGYLHLVDGMRPDVALYNEHGLVFSNRLFRAHKVERSEAEYLIKNYIDTTDRPIYYADKDFPNHYGANDYGLYQRVDKQLSDREQVTIADPLITRYFYHLMQAGKPVDPWETIHYRIMMRNFCRVLASLHELGEQTEQMSGWLANYCNHYYGNLAYIDVLLDIEKKNYEHVKRLLDSAISMREQSITKGDSAIPEYYRGKMLLRQGDTKGAIQSFQHAIERWPHPQNPAVERLKAISSEEKKSS